VRVGIVGQITGYGEGGITSFGQGLPEDAKAISVEFPNETVRYEGQDGTTLWFEGGCEIAEPEWIREGEDE
jgi:hypothetical protein